MKKLTHWFAIAALLFALHPTHLKAESNINLASMEPSITKMEMISSTETVKELFALPDAEMAIVRPASAAEAAYAGALEERLNQISEMDMSDMSFSEKNELRKEVRAFEKQQRGAGGEDISVASIKFRISKT